MAETGEMQDINIEIKVAGSALSKEIMKKLYSLTVEQHAWLPSRFEIRFNDDDRDLPIINGTQFDVGKEVEISGESVDAITGESFKGLLIKAEITALQPVFDSSSFIPSSLIVLGHTKDNRLIRGTKTQVFSNVKDSDIASQIAGNCGLTAAVDATSVTHEHVFQHNLTDMAFLAHLARRNGYTCYAEDGKLHFKKPSKGGQAPSLPFLYLLRSFQVHVNAAEQVDTVIVKGWDPGTKKAISSNVTSAETPFLRQTGFPKAGGDLAKDAFGSAELAVVDHPISSVDEAKAMAQARFNEIDSASVQAEGVAVFHPKIKAGSWVEVKDVGDKYSGSYWVGTATHIYEMGRGRTWFSTDGIPAKISQGFDRWNVQANGLNNLEDWAGTHAHVYELEHGRTRFSTDGIPAKISEGPDRWPGVVPAVVTDIEDPDELGRVKVKFPWLDDNSESTWARVVGIGAGPERGMLVLPEVDDEVLVVFEHGDFNYPYVLGGVWNATDEPPLEPGVTVSNGAVNLRTWKSRSGHRITMDDTDGTEKLEIMSKNEHRITMDDTAGEEKLEIQTQGGHLITMDDQENAVKIETPSGVMASFSDEGKIEINTLNATITLDDAQNMVTITSQGDLLLEAGRNLDLQANGDMNIKATNLNLAGNSLVEIKGNLIKLN